MSNYKIISKTDDENKKYKELIKEAYSHIDEAISHITYDNKFVDKNNFKVNELIIEQLNNIIYALEDLENAIVYKPVKTEE